MDKKVKVLFAMSGRAILGADDEDTLYIGRVIGSSGTLYWVKLEQKHLSLSEDIRLYMN